MAVLGRERLIRLVEENIVSGSSIENVSVQSIDLRLYRDIKISFRNKKKLFDLGFEESRLFDIHQQYEKQFITDGVIDLSKVKKYNNNESFVDYTMPDEGYILEPGEFILAATEEIFNMPDNLKATFTLKSGLARFGLQQAVAISGWSGWSGRLMLELTNQRKDYSLLIKPGILIGQMEFEDSDVIDQKDLHINNASNLITII